MENKAIILIDKRKFFDYEVSIPEQHAKIFEFVMQSHGWKPQRKGEHKNKTLSIEMMMQEEK